MATPLAAGAMTLMRQYFTDGYYPTGAKVASDGFEPSAALLRAVAINGAQSLTGFNDDGYPLDPPPSCKQGWGRLDLAKSVRVAGVAGAPAALYAVRRCRLTSG